MWCGVASRAMHPASPQVIGAAHATGASAGHVGAAAAVAQPPPALHAAPVGQQPSGQSTGSPGGQVRGVGAVPAAWAYGWDWGVAAR